MYKIIPITFILLLTVACSSVNEDGNNGEGIKTQPINYETDQERKDRLNTRDKTIGEKGGYPQSKQEGVNASDFHKGYSDPFTNEESELISKQLKEKKEIVQVQVAATDERIIVAVILSEKADPEIKKTIQEEVESIAPDKQITVYTDEVHWDHMKNLDARKGSEKREYDIEEYIDDFFRTED